MDDTKEEDAREIWRTRMRNKKGWEDVTVLYSSLETEVWLTRNTKKGRSWRILKWSSLISGLRLELTCLSALNDIGPPGFFYPELYDDQNGFNHLEMGYCEGQSFAPASSGELQLQFLQLLQALFILHSSGHVHRDLKNSHVLVDPATMKVHLIDFNLSCALLRRNYHTHPPFECYFGTVGFMAPEEMMGEAFKPSVDMWSAGMMLAVSFLGTDLTVVRLRDGPETEYVPRIQQFVVDLDGDLHVTAQQYRCYHPLAWDLMKKLLTIDPSSRLTSEQALSHPFFDEPLLLPEDPLFRYEERSSWKRDYESESWMTQQRTSAFYKRLIVRRYEQPKEDQRRTRRRRRKMRKEKECEKENKHEKKEKGTERCGRKGKQGKKEKEEEPKKENANQVYLMDGETGRQVTNLRHIAQAESIIFTNRIGAGEDGLDVDIVDVTVPVCVAYTGNGIDQPWLDIEVVPGRYNIPTRYAGNPEVWHPPPTLEADERMRATLFIPLS